MAPARSVALAQLPAGPERWKTVIPVTEDLKAKAKKLTKAKLGTLSLIFQRVYASRGDQGLNSFVSEVKDLEELLNFAKDVPLDTPMLYPQRLSSTSMLADEDSFHWTTKYKDSIFYNPSVTSDSGSTSSTSDHLMDAEDTYDLADDLQAGPSATPGGYEVRFPSLFMELPFPLTPPVLQTPRPAAPELPSEVINLPLAEELFGEDAVLAPTEAETTVAASFATAPPTIDTVEAPPETANPETRDSSVRLPTPPPLDLRQHRRTPRKGAQV